MSIFKTFYPCPKPYPPSLVHLYSHVQFGWHVMNPTSSIWCEDTRFNGISIVSSPVAPSIRLIPKRMSWSKVLKSHLEDTTEDVG